GWLVDDVIMVSHIDPELVDDPIDEDAGIQGIVNRESEFILWIDPEIELTLS
ncbi:MAG: chemotaxis protein CheW, partial [Halobacteriales archaeon]